REEILKKADLSRFGIAPDNYPLEDLKRKFLEEVRPRIKPQVHHDYKTLLDMATEQIGDPPLHELRHSLNEYITQRKADGKSAKTLNRTISLFKRMLAYGVQTNLIPFNPLADMPMFPGRRPPRRVLTVKEIGALLKHSGRWRPVWLAFLTTGLRHSELLQLQWQDIDISACTLVVRRSKTDAGLRVLPIAPVLSGELRALKQNSKGPDGFVFMARDTTVQKSKLLRAFKECLKRAGIDPTGLNIHSLRHTFATLLASGNAHPKHIQTLLGHKSAGFSLDVYTKVFGEDLQEAIKKIEIG
ncbi:MAG: tyrosine-type recombinase/integrase, partial [Planctomycetota bacterium]